MSKYLNLNYAILTLLGMIVLYGIYDPPKDMTVPYVVGHGDTLWEIASVYNAGDFNTERVIYQIAKANGIKNKGNLQVGQVIMVPPRLPIAN